MTHPFHWQALNPPPPAMRRKTLEGRLREAFEPELAERLVAMIRPAIRLWAQKPTSGASPFVSRFGGIPWLPPDTPWPEIDEGEPLSFIGQIHLPDLAGLPGAERLPARGILLFFGGVGILGGASSDYCTVLHLPRTTGLTAVPTPEFVDVWPEATLVPRALPTLPHAFTEVIQGLGLSKAKWDEYWDISHEPNWRGIPSSVAGYLGHSHLLGWADALQGETYGMSRGDLLLLQVGPYGNGTEHWGPGAHAYFMLPEADLAAGRFDRCELEVQTF